MAQAQHSEKQNTNSHPVIQFAFSNKSSWIVPTTVSEIGKAVIGQNFKVVSGGTSDEFWKFLVNNRPEIVVDVTKVKEMRCVQLTDNYLRIGASLTISEMQKELKSLITSLPGNYVHNLRIHLQNVVYYRNTEPEYKMMLNIFQSQRRKSLRL